MTRLQNFFYDNQQTTDDTTSIDYDYSLESEKDPGELDDFSVPLISIINDNDTDSNLYTIGDQDSESSTVQYEIELNDYSFRKPNVTENREVTPSIATSTVSTDLPQRGSEESAMVESHSDTRNVIPAPHQPPQNDSNASENRTASQIEEHHMNLSSKEHAESSETSKPESLETTSTKYRDNQPGESDNYSTTSSELVINESTDRFDETQTESSITNSSDTLAIHLDDYFDAILLNDSLLTDGTSSYETPSEDYDSTTLETFSQAILDSSPSDERKQNITDHDDAMESTTSVLLSSTPSSSSSSPKDSSSEESIRQNTAAASDKFAYHHSTTENLSEDRHDETPVKPTTLRFPEERGFVRFPDDPPQTTTSFTWPRDNGRHSGGLMRFWQRQPLLSDDRFVSRGNSRGPSSGGLHRVLSYRRNYR